MNEVAINVAVITLFLLIGLSSEWLAHRRKNAMTSHAVSLPNKET